MLQYLNEKTDFQNISKQLQRFPRTKAFPNVSKQIAQTNKIIVPEKD